MSKCCRFKSVQNSTFLVFLIQNFLVLHGPSNLKSISLTLISKLKVFFCKRYCWLTVNFIHKSMLMLQIEIISLYLKQHSFSTSSLNRQPMHSFHLFPNILITLEITLPQHSVFFSNPFMLKCGQLNYSRFKSVAQNV